MCAVANIDVDDNYSSLRHPKALVKIYRQSVAEERATERPAAPQRPRYSRIDAGQLIRALLLVVICLGLAQLSRADHSRAENRAVRSNAVAAS
jgi:hypothetical protein